MKHRMLQVRDLMTRDPIVVAPDLPLYEAYALMYENEIRRLPVVSSEGLVGIVTLSDIQRALPSAFDAYDTDTRLEDLAAQRRRYHVARPLHRRSRRYDPVGGRADA